MIEVGLDQKPTIHGKEADEFRKKAKEFLKKAREKNIIVKLPSE